MGILRLDKPYFMLTNSLEALRYQCWNRFVKVCLISVVGGSLMKSRNGRDVTFCRYRKYPRSGKSSNPFKKAWHNNPKQ